MCLCCGAGFYKNEAIKNTDLAKKHIYSIMKDFKYLDPCFLDYTPEITKVVPKEIIQEIWDSRDFLPEHEWLNSIVLITKEKVITNVFTDGSDDYVLHTVEDYPFYFRGAVNHNINCEKTDDINFGFHSDCYTLLQNMGTDLSWENLSKYGNLLGFGIITNLEDPIKKYQYTFIGFDDIYNRMKTQTHTRTGTTLEFIASNQYKHNFFESYLHQAFYDNLAYLENPYLLESPLKNSQNRERIEKYLVHFLKPEAVIPKKPIDPKKPIEPVIPKKPIKIQLKQNPKQNKNT